MRTENTAAVLRLESWRQALGPRLYRFTRWRARAQSYLFPSRLHRMQFSSVHHCNGSLLGMNTTWTSGLGTGSFPPASIVIISLVLLIYLLNKSKSDIYDFVMIYHFNGRMIATKKNDKRDIISIWFRFSFQRLKIIAMYSLVILLIVPCHTVAP